MLRPAFFFLLATATALQGPAQTGRRACIVRTRPASACLGEPLSNDDPLQALDVLKPMLSYGGWQRDAAAVEVDLVRCGPSVASRLLATMRRKQLLHEGDRSDAVLQVLDEAKQGLSYDGWETDVERAERDWVGGWSTVTGIRAVRDKMRRKQRLHEGDRSDVVLHVLDGVKQGLAYESWEQDVRAVERDWVEGEDTEEIQDMIATMRRKQRLHEGDLSDAVLQVLDDVKRGLSYTGWEADVDRVERDWAGGRDTCIEEAVGKMRRKQLEYTFRKFSTTDGQSA